MLKPGLNAAALILLAGLAPAIAMAGIQIGGGSLSLGGGRIDLGCSTLSIGSNGRLDAQQGQVNHAGSVLNAGEFQASQGQFTVSGTWTNTGDFAAEQSTVQITDDCQDTTTLNGDTAFWRLQAAGIGQQLVFGSGTTQHVQDSLVLLGNSASNRLFLRSSTPGQPAFINLVPTGVQEIFWVDVADNHASPAGQALAVGFPETFESVDSGGNRNWFTDGLMPALPVPFLTPLTVGLLILLLLVIGMLQQRRRAPTQFILIDKDTP